MKPFAKKFYKSRAWQSCRSSYILSVNGLCERCRRKGRIVPGKIVHHKVLLTPENISDPQVSLNHELLEYLCQSCHNDEHHGSSEEVLDEELMFDSNGDLIKKNY